MKKTTKKAFNVAIASAMAAGAVVAVAPTQAGAALSFSDVKETNGHYANILNLAERGIINGYEDGTFRPGDSIKRGNAAKIIAGILGLDTTNVTNPGFKDVTVNNSNYGAIAALAGLGIINGFEDNTYRANDTLTRGQMSKIIANAFKLTATNTDIPFTDVQNSQYKENIAALFENGVTTGKTETTFDARSAVTRGQLASFVVRAEEVGKKEQTVTTTTDKTAAVVAVTEGKVTIAGEELEVAEELKAVFNTANAAALTNSEVAFVIEYTVTKTASVANVAPKGKIVGIKGVKLVNEDTTFDAKGYTIPSVVVAAKNVTLTNVVTPKVELEKDATVVLTNVKVETLQVPTGAKVTLDKDTVIATIVLDKGQKLEDVITNYEEVKEALATVAVKENETSVAPTPAPAPTPSEPGTGGDVTGPVAPVEPEVVETVATFIAEVEAALNGLTVGTVGSVSLAGDQLIISVDGSAKVSEALNLVDSVKGALSPLNAKSPKFVTKISVNVGGDSSTVSNTESGFSDSKLVSIVLPIVLGGSTDISSVASKTFAEVLGSSPSSATVDITFTDGTSSTYNVGLQLN